MCMCSVVLQALVLSVTMDCTNTISENINFQINLFGIDEKLSLSQTFFIYNNTDVIVSVQFTYHGLAEYFAFCSEGLESNYTNVDTVCTARRMDCPLQHEYTSVLLNSMSCILKIQYASNIEHNEIKHMDLFGAETFVNAVINQEWTSVVILYQDKFGETTYRIVNILAEHNILVILVNVDTLNNTELIAHLSTSFTLTENMTLICDTICVERTFNLVDLINIIDDKGKLIVHRTKWIILDQDGNCSTILPDVAVNITNVVLIEPNTYYNVHFKNVESVCIDGDVHRMIDNHNQYMSKDHLYNIAKSATIINIDKLYSTRKYQIKTLVFKAKGRELIDVGLHKDGGSRSKEQLFPNTQYGFNGKTLQVAALEWRPFNERHSEGNYTGFTMIILQRLANRLNFTYEIVEPGDGEWGILKNSSWTGLIGLLNQTKVDLVATPLSVTYERSQAVDFLYPIFFDTSKLVLRRPEDEEEKWKTLLNIFSFTVLIFIGASLLFATGFLCFVEKINPYYQLIENQQKSRLNTLSDCLWYNYGALLTQGGTNTPDAQTGRTVLSYWWIFCMASMAIYSGNLVAFLTIATDELPFKSMAEMVKQNKYQWGLYGGGAMEMFFSQSTLQVQRDVWNGMVSFNHSDPSVFSSSEDRQYSKVMNDNYVYVTSALVAEYYKASGMDLVFLPGDITTVPNAFAVRKNSPYEKIFSREIIRMHETGFLNMWLKDGYPRNGSDFSSPKFKAKAITLEDVQSAFYLIGVGIASSFILWLAENIWFKLSKANVNIKTNHVSLTGIK